MGIITIIKVRRQLLETWMAGNREAFLEKVNTSSKSLIIRINQPTIDKRYSRQENQSDIKCQTGLRITKCSMLESRY